MSAPRQRTLAGEVTLDGTGVHSGESARLTIAPASVDTGLRFRRSDLDGSPEILADIDNVVGTERGTVLGLGDAKVRTVEHVLASLYAAGIDNALLSVDGPEVPIRDGSFRDFTAAIDEAGAVEQDAEARVITLSGAVQAGGGDAPSYVATPADELRVAASIDFAHEAIGRQFASFTVDDTTFATEIAPARTFGLKSDADELRERGLALGASVENAIVLDDDGVMSGELRFGDEFVRHKIGDLIGDLALLGARLHGSVVAERPSHEGNVEFAGAIRRHAQLAGAPFADITQIMDFLPHRYPLLLVDRILDFIPGRKVVGMKNVTINEPFFQGHFPGHPIMPGVLIIEAMAQCGGMLLMDEVDDPKSKVVYFMTMDKVKFRRPVTPGDTLIFELEILSFKRQVGQIVGRGVVNGRTVAEAEFKARIVDR